MAIHSSILAWIITWTEKPDGLQSMGSQRIRQTLSLSLSFPSQGVSCSSPESLKVASTPLPRH